MITNLLSLYKLHQQDVYFHSDNLTLQLSSINKELRYSEELDNLFILKTLKSSQLNSIALISRVASVSISKTQSIEILHKQLGHLDIHDVKKLINMTTSMKIGSNSMSDMCKDCVQDKQTQNVSHTQGN